MVQRSPEQIAFPELSPTQVACVAALGERRSLQDGEFLVRAGQKDYPFWVVESSEVSIIDSTSGEPREVVRHGPNTFVGDIDILTGRPAVISAIASGNCVAFEVSADKIRRLLEQASHGHVV